MTATNHAMAGVVIALVVKRPEWVLPLAFLSHFVLDSLPQFGYKDKDVFKRNERTLSKVVLAADILLLVVTMVGIGLLSHPGVSNWLLYAGALAAYSPDILWVPRFIQEVRTHTWSSGGIFVRFHAWIQWCERPWGLVFEVFWLLGSFVAVKVLV